MKIKALSISLVTYLLCLNYTSAQDIKSLENDFLSPKPEHQSIIIWQWMDGLVTREGITADLEAFKEAGLSGVQNFQIGGPRQIRVSDPTTSIGSNKWKELMRWAMDECERLGLTFGTHNCPGWSSSAYPSVEPKYSMLKLVYSETKIPQNFKNKELVLPRPEIDSIWNYYEDVIVLAIPADSIIKKDQVIDVSKHFDKETGKLSLAPDWNKDLCFLRIGQTTIGKTNASQSPESGCGLECDKLNRIAVKKFWDAYPQMIIEIAGHHAGKTFTHFEIDSYEAGGQTWSSILPEEFKQRRGYDITPYIPYMIGRCKQIEDSKETTRFRKDWQFTIQQLFAENYYGYMTELAQEIPGLNLLIEPYGTGGQRPFSIINLYKILDAAKGADIATEFWTYPNWGWKDMVKHEKAMRSLQFPILYAEAFTCWPLKAWQDDPQTLKSVCDRAYCTGVNKMMLHAGAANPWPHVEPGMSFGIWGTQFVPKQTWWKAGGAKELFGYMARCQALLQKGLPAKEQLPPMSHFKTYKRINGEIEIFFVCNPYDQIKTDTLFLKRKGKTIEIWNPYTKEMNLLSDKREIENTDNSPLLLTIESFGSRFIILHPDECQKQKSKTFQTISSIPISGSWTLSFPNESDFTIDSLCSWSESMNKNIKYFSGTATYKTSFKIKKKQLKDQEARYILTLGEVKNMAQVTINGTQCPILWKKPFECDITEYLIKGENKIEISVTNLWPNRMIGDEQEPDDIQWSEPLRYEYAPGSPIAGRYMTQIPDWLRLGKPRPSQGRKTVYCFKFFKADSPLLPSGLFGPVKIEQRKQIKNLGE